jgi:hypothetical protein
MLSDLVGATKALASLSEGLELIKERDGEIAAAHLAGLDRLAHYAEDCASKIDRVIAAGGFVFKVPAASAAAVSTHYSRRFRALSMRAPRSV